MGIHQLIAPAADTRSNPGGSSLSEVDTLADALAVRRAVFTSDLADGLIGRHHNTYEHRARVIRQMAARLRTLRMSEAGNGA